MGQKAGKGEKREREDGKGDRERRREEGFILRGEKTPKNEREFDKFFNFGG